MVEEKRYDIFISYRRDDVGGYAHLIKEELEKTLEVFFDVDDIKAGEAFPARLEDAIESSKIILSIVGKNSCEEFKKRIGKLDYVAEEIKYAKSCDKIIIPILLEGADIPKEECLPKSLAFFPVLNAIDILHRDFKRTILNLQQVIREKLNDKPVKIKKEFNNAEKLLHLLYPRKKLVTEEKGSIKYQYWTCGKEADPNYYLVFFPSTNSISRAVENFIEKIESKKIVKPKRLLTILRDTNIRTSTLKLIDENLINKSFYTYQDYFWEECIPEEIKKYKYHITKDEYYIDQNLYFYDDIRTQKPIGKVSDIVMEYIKGNSDKPVLAIIAQAGAGKTTFIEYVIERIDINPKLQCIYISSDEIKEKFSNADILPSIETVYNLYEYCNDKRRFDEQKLLMGLTSGSIAIIIDGLEEIIALFNTQNKFNSDKFFDSLIEINNQLAKCKVIVTSREPNDSKNDIIDREEILVYRLQGFDDDLVEEYLNKKRFPLKRFFDKELSEKHRKKTYKYLKEINKKFKSKNTIPYILDLICESVEEEFEGTNDDLSFDFHEEYSSNREAIDAIVYSYFFSRELVRQSYPEDFTPKDLAYLFIDLSLDAGWIFSEDKMLEIIEETNPNQYKQIVDNLTRAPLLVRAQDNSYKFKYDFLYNYFITLYLIQVFNGGKLKHYPYLILSKLSNDIILDVTKFFSETNEKKKTYMENAREILQELIKKVKENKNALSYQKAIDNLIKLTIKINSSSLDSERNMELIKELYEIGEKINKIEYLFLFEEAQPLDFKNIEIWHSKFIKYENFFKSKFLNTKFLYSSFRDMKGYYRGEQVWNDVDFDITCELGDLKSIIMDEESFMEAKKTIRKVLRSIQKHDTIKHNKIVLECLQGVNFIKHENSSYVLTRNGKSYLGGKINKKAREAIECIVSRQRKRV